jgi:hypothetical protein
MLGKSQAPAISRLDKPSATPRTTSCSRLERTGSPADSTSRIGSEPRKALDHISELRTICPDPALMNAMNALGETFRGFRTRENSMGATVECLNHMRRA